jgi:hypothetical protein
VSTSTVLCQVVGCGRPVPGVSLCGEHRDELVEALLALATGGRELYRVHEVFRDRPASRAGDPALAAGEVVVAVPPGERPGLLAELQTTVTRQHRLGGGGIPAAGGSEPPLLFHVAASALAGEARSIVGTWARDLAETHPHLELPSTHEAAARWLATFPSLLAEHRAAGEMHRDVTRLVRTIRRVIDRPADRRYLGQCGAALAVPEGEPEAFCEADIYAPPGRGAVNCPGCGAVWDVLERQAFLLDEVDDQLATAVDASRALSALDVPCTSAMIRGYAHRGKLTPHPPHPLDPRKHARYRIGDIRKLLAEAASEGGGSAA